MLITLRCNNYLEEGGGNVKLEGGIGSNDNKGGGVSLNILIM